MSKNKHIDLSPVSATIYEQLRPILMQAVKESIKDRVARGIGEGDKLMLPYKPSTAKQRVQDGRQGAFRDLYHSGKMMDDLEVRQTPQGFEVYFVTDESSKKAYHTDLATPWLTLTPKDLQAASDAVAKNLSTLLKK